MRRTLLVALALLQGGCIIGTWPTPENSGDSQTTADDAPGGTFLSPEVCDELDNDADGAVDDGCPCVPGQQRGCIGVLAGQCHLGVQSCIAGRWSECADLGPPFVGEISPSVTLKSFAPATLERGQDETLMVVAIPQARCPGIQVHRVQAVLEATTPLMRIRRFARDDGVYPDTTANDGEFAAVLTNPFGPGVPAQSLRLRLIATAGGIDVSDEGVVPLEEP